MARPLKLLACIFQGGGNIPLILPILAELAARGHRTRVMIGPGVRHSRLSVSASLLRRIGEMEVEVVPFRESEVHPFDDAAFSERGLIGSWTPQSVRNVQREARTPVWAPIWARNVSDELRREPTDGLVADFVLLGALVAAEAAGIPHVALMHTVYPWPVAGIPPYGPGHLPKAGVLGHWRDLIGRKLVERLWAHNGLPPLNRSRQLLGLPALRRPFQQYDAAARVLVLVSSAFDWQSPHLPPNVRHVGTPGDEPRPGQPAGAWLPEGDQPLVVVALSTLNQGQAPTLSKILVALSGLQVRALVTLGPALNAEQFEVPANVRCETFVPHDLVLPHASALVTQCGIGTLTKGLHHGVPMVCLPLVGDQHDNAARVVARNAGLRLPADATPDRIRWAIARVVEDRRFKEGAVHLGKALEANAARHAADEIKRATQSAPMR